MRISYSRALYLAALLSLILLTLRPPGSLERGLDVCLVPGRVLAEVGRPVAWLGRGSVWAQERRLEELVPSDYAASRALHSDERRFALPDEEGLLAGRRFVHGQVVGRVEGNSDRILVELDGADLRGVEQGLPVIAGNAYVGRVWALDPARGCVEVALVTGKSFFVGARLDDPEGREPVAMVVGGLAAGVGEGGEALALAIHNPSRREDLQGIARVDEGLNLRERFQREADGFLLGRVVRAGGDAYAIAAELDYRDGLFQVAVVLPADAPRPVVEQQSDVFTDGHWLATHALSRGAPCRWREGVKVACGRWNGIEDGAAVVAGARLVGRVLHAGAVMADVALLRDPGFTVTAVARVEGQERPWILGRVTSLGRDSETGEVLLTWHSRGLKEEEARVSSAPEGQAGPGAAGRRPLIAQLFTGAGEAGVPRGLLIGETVLPPEEGVHVLRLGQSVDVTRLSELWVRLEARQRAVSEPVGGP